MPWKEFDRSLNLGYLDEPVWIRIDLAGSSEELTMLEVAYPNLDAIDAYYVRNGQVLSQVETGDRSLFAERAWPHRNFIFPLDSEAEFIYLRVQTRPRCRSRSRDADQFSRHDQGALLRHIFLGVLIVMALTISLFSRAPRDVVHLYVGYVFSIVLPPFTMD